MNKIQKNENLKGEIEIRSFNNDRQFLKRKYENENEYIIN